MRNIVRKLLLSSIILMTSSCGFSNKTDTNSEVPVYNNTVGDITIDNAGVVPILGLNRPTTTSIFIHNHSDEIVRNVSFDSTNVRQNLFARVLSFLTGNPISVGIKVDSLSASTCSIIPAHGSCALKFTTPSFSTDGNQGSGSIAAKYKVNGEEKVFNQVINYQQVEIKDWLNISSGVNMNSYGYDNSYGTIYLYSGNQNNKVEDLTLNRPAFSISNNNIIGSELVPLQVQALEITAPANISASMKTILAVSTKGVGVTSTAGITALPSNSGAILVSGILPNYDLNGQASLTGNLYTITNVGNESATLGTITPSMSSIKFGTGYNSCQAGMVLAIGGACNVYFDIDPQTESDRISATGIITVAYTSMSVANGSLVNSINWINSQKGGLVSMEFISPVVFIQNDGTYGLTESFTVKIKNIGGANLSNIVIGARGVTGRLYVESVSSCANTLNVGNSCTINVKVYDKFVEDTKQILLTFNAVAGLGSTVYNRSSVVTYNVITNKPLFVLQPVPTTYQIFGNGKESQTGVIVVSNNGATSTSTGRIDSSKFTLFDNFFNVDLGTEKCRLTQTLAVGESCLVTIRLNSKNEAIALGESGTAVYTLNTTGLNLGESGVTRANIPFRVLPNSQGFKITNVTLADSDSGDGTSANHFVLGGEKKLSKVIIRYENESSNKLRVMGMYESGTSGIFWNRESFSVIDVNPGESFTVTYTNVLGSNRANYLSNTSMNPVENIMLPTLYFQDFTLAESNPTPFKQTVYYNSGSYVYVDGKLGTLTNNVTINNPGLVTESYTLSSQFGLNGRNYGSNIVVNSFADISGNTLLSNTNCIPTESLAVTLIVCTLNNTQTSGYATYGVQSSYILESSTLFNVYYNRPGYNLDTNGQAVVVNLTENTVTLPQLKWQQVANTQIQSNQKVLKLGLDSNNTKFILVSESGGNYDGQISLLKESNGLVTPLVRGIGTTSYASMKVNSFDNNVYIAYIGANNYANIVRYNTSTSMIESLFVGTDSLSSKNPSISVYKDATNVIFTDILFIGSDSKLVRYNNSSNDLSSWTKYTSANTYLLAVINENNKTNSFNIGVDSNNAVDTLYPTTSDYLNVGSQTIQGIANSKSMALSIGSNSDLFLAYDDWNSSFGKLKIAYYDGSQPINSGSWSSVTYSDGVANSIASRMPASNQPFISYVDDGNLKVIRYIGTPFAKNRFQLFGGFDIGNFTGSLNNNQLVDVDFDKVSNYPVVVYVDPADSTVKVSTLSLDAGI